MQSNTGNPKCGTKPALKPRLADNPRVITIKVDEEDSITYEPSVQRASPGDYVSWRSPDADFTLVFLPRTPLGKVYEVYCSREGTTPPLPIEKDAQGSYHYKVGLWTGTRVVLDVESPEIIVG